MVKCEQDIAYLMYNDQPPFGSKSMYHGHTKGELTTKIVTILCCKITLVLEAIFSCCLQ